eukprot:1035393-Pleurochrysis_carterae.AAC.1
MGRMYEVTLRVWHCHQPPMLVPGRQGAELLATWGVRRQRAALKQVRSLAPFASAEEIALPYALWQTGWLLLP